MSEKVLTFSEKQTMRYETLVDLPGSSSWNFLPGPHTIALLRRGNPIRPIDWRKLRQGAVPSNAYARLLSAQFAIGVLAQNSFMARANAMAALNPAQTPVQTAIRHWRNPGIVWRGSRKFADTPSADLLVYPNCGPSRSAEPSAKVRRIVRGDKILYT
ncbi:MAG: hypothetical protein OXG39_19385 [Chloroflexi bacterium]|nr:hypothetical protein [Chloroflexota bacterium]